MDVVRLRRLLGAWYRRNARDMPWRRSRDPYAIWVSETMLQQTRVDVATPYFLAWMKRFPTVEALAEASTEQVLAAWSGLGYYRRARNLHAAARQISATTNPTQGTGLSPGAKRLHKANAPGVPATAEALAELPGVGPYTAAAVASIAFGEPVACIDGNVTRVVARLAALEGDVQVAAMRRQVADLAQAWLAPASPGDWNQAMMELGATVCLPRNPRCDECPVAALCAANHGGKQAHIPAPRKRSPPVVEARHVAIIRDGSRVLLTRERDSLLSGMWGLPSAADPDDLEAAVTRQTTCAVTLGDSVGAATHQFSHRTWNLQVHSAELRSRPNRLPAGARWMTEAQLRSAAVPAATRKALAVAGVAFAAKRARLRGGTS